MNIRLLKVAKFLGKQGLYEEAALLKALAQEDREDISPPEWREVVDSFFKSLTEEDKKDLYGDSVRIWKAFFKEFLRENYSDLENDMDMIFDLIKDDKRCTCAEDEDEDEDNIIPKDTHLFGVNPIDLIRNS